MLLYFLLFVVIIVALLFCLHTSSGKSTDRQKINRHNNSSWREDISPGAFTIYERKGNWTSATTYNGGERYIDGHKCMTKDDMMRWFVMKGLSDGLARRLSQVEYELSRTNEAIGNELYEEWKTRYSKYRQLCITHGIWNLVIHDNSPFIPTSPQMKKESEKKQQIEQLYSEWQQRLTDNQILLDYLNKCPRKHAPKNVMISDLSGGDQTRKKHILDIYRRLRDSDIIAEKQNSTKTVETRIIIRRSKHEPNIPILPASTYDTERYSNVRLYDVYKAEYTASSPQNVNRETNTCTFESLSTGEIYATSLEKCTCIAYKQAGICKHMVSLAIHLGYFNRSSAKQ